MAPKAAGMSLGGVLWWYGGALDDDDWVGLVEFAVGLSWFLVFFLVVFCAALG